MSRMSRAACRFIVATLFSGLFLAPSAAYAQEEKANILTPDGVMLKGVFYPSTAKNAPTVIMLHPIGEGKSMKAPEWKNLAEVLNKAKYSVMMFDFRGHGESTSIDDPKAFWNARTTAGTMPNAVNVRSKEKDSIDVKDYIKQISAYAPVLVNDIAAVRAWLDRRNDTDKDCNTSSLIVIGAESGATLGALWINAENYRYKYTPPGPMMKMQLDTRSEGRDIIAAVFLTAQPLVEKRAFKLESLLKSSCKDQGMAAAFVFGKQDTKGANLAKYLEKNLKVSKDSKKHAYIQTAEVPDTNLTGMKLLVKGTKVDEGIVDYLKEVVDERKNTWVERDFPNSYYMWRLGPTSQMIPAKKLPSEGGKGEKNLKFDSYERFNFQ